MDKTITCHASIEEMKRAEYRAWQQVPPEERMRATMELTMALYALCVWPANFKHALDGIDLAYVSSSWLYHGPRLVLQPVIMWWALYCAGVIDWPWRKCSSAGSSR